MTAVTEKADKEFAALVDELRSPSDPRTNGSCTLELIVPPYILLINADGNAVLPQIPTDGCGKPRIEARDALDAMPFKTVSETPVKQVQSQQSVDTGCSDTWKDEIAIEAAGLKPGPAAELWAAPPATVRVCVYDRITDQVGTFVAGKKIPGVQLTALDTAGPAVPCSAQHTRFATLIDENTQAWAVAELDGCLRLLRPDRSLGQLDRATVAALTK
ncbi:MAG: hypothetical protein ABW224_16110 [Kibdelosporangium sp.]